MSNASGENHTETPAPNPLPVGVTGAHTRGAVAIVEDDQDIALALSQWVELLGMRSVHHVSAESLLSAVQQQDGQLLMPSSDARRAVEPLVGAVLDLNLPGRTGIELASTLRRLSPQLPIAIITALSASDRSCYGVPPAGIRCLQKPFQLSELEDALFPWMY